MKNTNMEDLRNKDRKKWDEYKSSGLHVFPVSMPDKRPTVKSWKALPDNIIFNGSAAIACGELSGNIEVLDFDTKNTTRDLLTEYFDEGGDVLNTIYKKLVVQTTISGGFHFIYRCEVIEGNQKIAVSSDGKKALIETRGEGGYFVTAPTEGYKIIQGDIINIPYITQEEREILITTARRLNEYFPKVNPPKNKVYTDGLTPWDDFDQRGDVPALLQAHDWQFIKSVGDNDHYCRPGKKGATSATWNESLRLFYCFTSSTVFEPSKAYAPSALYSYLECNGDFSEAARKLRALGYGAMVEEKPTTKAKCVEIKNLFRLTKPTSMERPKKLFGPLWAEGENAFFFAEDGAGKSILAVQIGCAIATGQSIQGFQNEVPKQPVTLFDTELSDYQFNTRYPEGLPENFKRFTFNEDAQKLLIDSTVEFVVDQIENAANHIGSKIIILDNLSALASMVDLVTTKEAVKLMGLLNELKKKGFSVLIIDHSRKPLKEGDFKVISKHDLQGSKMKTNLVDSVFSIGKSAQGDAIRYIKGLKIRSFEMAYTKGSVATVEIKVNPLRLEFLGVDPEWQHVKDRTSEMMKMAAEGKTQAEIAQTFNVSQQAISKILNTGL
ncbi:MAG: AAA family ATPase [Cyclobacteriaceae bacterium]|nr:MAG: AAA family ATPase [Cyclobacteriaceae bacterium]